MKVVIGEEIFEVKFVNECRAYVEPIEKSRTVTIDNPFDDEKPKTFQARRRGFSISPNSELEIVP
jgi:hypothetical protein